MTNAAAIITYGHSSEEISPALESLKKLSRQQPLRVVVLDDSSDSPPVPSDGAEYLSTPARAGYSGAVNYLVSQLGPEVSRVLLVNPDATIGPSTGARLLASTAEVAVPSIPHGRTLTNVRACVTPRHQAASLLFGWRVTDSGPPFVLADVDRYLPLGRPWTCSGAVICYMVEALRRCPLSEDMSWLEMSDWARRMAATGSPSLHVLADLASHSGGSTAKRYPRTVLLAQIAARGSYIRRYGCKSDLALAQLGLVGYVAAHRRDALSWPKDVIGARDVLLGHRDWKTL